MLVGMYCSKEYRGTGIAKNVVEFILEKARNLEGLKIINLMVVSENLRAKAFYESFGFKNMVLNQNLCLMNLNIMMKI
ncbi:GNAT family N-acetyltransferase (plasmid) [Staphylococcus aureus]|nr:GNAT family N-acetyltransferase [Staphylococcus aureus]